MYVALVIPKTMSHQHPQAAVMCVISTQVAVSCQGVFIFVSPFSFQGVPGIPGAAGTRVSCSFEMFFLFFSGLFCINWCPASVAETGSE